MAAFKWLFRPTRFFGDVPLPMANVGILGTTGIFHQFAFQIDSGAVVSLLRRSSAELLGVVLESGRRVELGSVGGATINAYVHELETRFDEHTLISIPYAIADTEFVPNLLGRHEVLSRLQIHFDPTRQETRVSSD